MLYLNRKPGEAVVINHCIEVRVIEVRGKTVKLGFTFPAEASVLREEVFVAIRQANEAAALNGAAGLLEFDGLEGSVAAGTDRVIGDD